MCTLLLNIYSRSMHSLFKQKKKGLPNFQKNSSGILVSDQNQQDRDMGVHSFQFPPVTASKKMLNLSASSSDIKNF